MVVKSFFRRKNTKVYLFLNTIIIFIIMLLIVIINLFNNKVDDIFTQSSSFITCSKNDWLKEIKKHKDIINTKKAILLDTSENNDVITPFPSNYEKLAWGDITNRSVDYKVVAYDEKDKNLNLEFNELAIGLSTLEYLNYEHLFDDIIGHDINFTFKDREVTFKIKEIYDAKHQGEVVIDSDNFNKLLSEVDYHLYMSQITNEEIAYSIEAEFVKMKQNGDIAVLVQDYSSGEMEGLDKSKNYISILKYVCYFIIIVFVIFIIIIDRNMLYDLDYNILLEKNFGFSKFKIKTYLVKRILSLYLLSFLIGFVFSFICAWFMNISLFSYILYSFYVILFIVIGNVGIICFKKINF